MYSGNVFDEVQALIQDRELIAQRVQLQANALRARAEYAAETTQAQPAAAPRFWRFAPHFRSSSRVRLG